MFQSAVEDKADIIISDTNLQQKYIDNWKALAAEVGYEFEIKLFPITLEEAWKRDSKRGALSVGKDVITKQWQSWLKLSGRKTYIANENLAPAIICDIDGTLAEMYNRGAYEWSKVGGDNPRQFVMDLIKSYLEKYPATQLIIVSGRDSVCEKQTRQWLNDNEMFQDALFMRKSGDYRPDTIVKEEIFWGSISSNYNVLFCVDDRPCVVRLWKDLGLNVVDVSKGYVEF